MKFLKWFIILVAVLLGLFVLITAFLPKTYYVERSVEIDAPVLLIYGQVSDLHSWQEWNPWGELDPEMGLAYSNPTSGTGAWYEWTSEIAGDGKMTIIETIPLESARYELIFEGYEELPSYSSITLEPLGEDRPVVVTWTFEGTVGKKFFARWMTVMVDKFVGESYEKGLQKLKERCEAMAFEDPAPAN